MHSPSPSKHGSHSSEQVNLLCHLKIQSINYKMQNLIQISCPVSPQWFLIQTIWLNISILHTTHTTDNPTLSSKPELQQSLRAKREGKRASWHLLWSLWESLVPQRFIFLSVETHEHGGLTRGRGSCSNTCLTGPFINHAKTTHNTDQNKKDLYSLDKQQNESVLKGF